MTKYSGNKGYYTSIISVEIFAIESDLEAIGNQTTITNALIKADLPSVLNAIILEQMHLSDLIP